MTATAPPSPLLNIEEAADYLRTTVRHIRRLKQEQRVGYTKVGGKLRFKVADLDAFIEEQHVPAHEQGVRR